MDDITYQRDPLFSGRPGEWISQFTTRADAVQYVEWLRDGTLDPFLMETWTDIEISQERDSGGRFGSGWRVRVEIVRPAPGEDYDIGDFPVDEVLGV